MSGSWTQSPPSIWRKKNINYEEIHIHLLKFRYCEKATQFEKISHLFLELLSNVSGRFFQIFVVFSEHSNFNWMTHFTAYHMHATEKGTWFFNFVIDISFFLIVILLQQYDNKTMKRWTISILFSDHFAEGLNCLKLVGPSYITTYAMERKKICDGNLSYTAWAIGQTFAEEILSKGTNFMLFFICR